MSEYPCYSNNLFKITLEHLHNKGNIESIAKENASRLAVTSRGCVNHTCITKCSGHGQSVEFRVDSLFSE